jgi:endonuclease/exonuclease/phosphatase (EEP) superfamily protein YafD
VHLDALNTSHHLWIFGTRGWRATQAKALESLLPGGNLVLGADLNTWFGAGEPAPRYFRRLFAETTARVDGSGPHRRVLDYMFFRCSPPATAHYRVVADKYGSDHHALIGWFSN